MNNKNYRNMTKAELVQALQQLQSKARSGTSSASAAPYGRLLHDLQVHQEELEAQNQSLRETQQALEESRSRYAELYDLAPLGYVTLTRKGIIAEINLTGAAMLGIERSRLIRSPFTHSVVKEDKPIFREHLMRCQEEAEMATAELRLRRSDGTTLFVELHSVPTRVLNGSPGGCLTALTDISSRKRSEHAKEEAEAEVRRLNQDLARRAAELAVVNQELESFAYSVSHDLRAPLAAIDNFTSLVTQDYGEELPPEGRQFLDLIQANTLSMSRLIEDLLAFSRSSRRELKKQPVATIELVRKVVADLKSANAGRDIEVITGTLPRCQADPALLTQVWVNLISNAFKFTSKCVHAHIEIGSYTAENKTVYFVKDNGVGFDPQDMPRLFRVFQRLHSEEDYPGTGVGLAIVDRIVRRHGGRVWAEGKVGEGATFYFTLE